MNREYVYNAVIGVLVFLFFIIGIGYVIYEDYSEEKEYGEMRYEIVIIDKYDHLGSTYHFLLGGRATEQEFHVEYKYRLLNRPQREENMKWYYATDEVSHGYYRKIKIGQRLYTDYKPIFLH